LAPWRVVALVLAFPASAAECPTTPPPGLTFTATAVDGETLKLADGSLLRLAGIEAPRAPIEATEPSPAGEAARAHLATLVRKMPLGVIETGAGPDRYGQRHGWVFAGERLVQAELGAAGYARVRWLAGEEACFATLLAAELAPRTARLGLWGDKQYAVRSATDPSLRMRTGLYERVAGRVVSVGHGECLVFIDFGRNFRQDFTILVSQAIAEQLAQEGRPVDELVGSQVEVRGMVEESGGPAIRLNDAAEIAVVQERE